MTRRALDVFFHLWNYFGSFLCDSPGGRGGARGARDVASWSTVEVSTLA